MSRHSRPPWLHTAGASVGPSTRPTHPVIRIRRIFAPRSREASTSISGSSRRTSGNSHARRLSHAHDHDAGRHADLLQGLGQWTARRLQPRLAAERGCLGRPDVLSGLAWLPLYRPRPPRPWAFESALAR